MNPLDRLLNPRSQAVRKWMSEMLRDRFPKHEVFLERLGHSIVTNQDLEGFGKLAVDLYEVGYLKCLNDYKKKLSELGINVSLVAEQPKTN